MLLWYLEYVHLVFSICILYISYSLLSEKIWCNLYLSMSVPQHKWRFNVFLKYKSARCFKRFLYINISHNHSCWLSNVSFACISMPYKCNLLLLWLWAYLLDLLLLMDLFTFQLIPFGIFPPWFHLYQANVRTTTLWKHAHDSTYNWNNIYLCASLLVCEVTALHFPFQSMFLTNRLIKITILISSLKTFKVNSNVTLNVREKI